MSPYLNVAEQAALDAGRIIACRAKRPHEIEVRAKGRNDPVTNVDLECEREIAGRLRRAFPDHDVVCEESGARRDGGEWQWLVDPLDGTANFLRGFPHYAVSIALLRRGTPVVGAIFDPFKNELFLAERGKGATLNRRKIRASATTELDGALIGTGIPYRPDQDLDGYLETLRPVARAANVRRAGSAALDLAYVACARLDGFWEFGLRPWDVAAGVVVVREAGGLIGEPGGDGDCLETGDVLAANPALFKTMTNLFRQPDRAKESGIARDNPAANP